MSVCLSICLSTYPSICLSIYLLSSLSLSVYAIVYRPNCLSMRPSVYLSFYFSLSRSIHFLVYLCVFPLVCRSIHLSSCLPAHPAIHCIHLSTEAFHPSIYLVLHLSAQTVRRQAVNICREAKQCK